MRRDEDNKEKCRYRFDIAGTHFLGPPDEKIRKKRKIKKFGGQQTNVKNGTKRTSHKNKKKSSSKNKARMREWRTFS